MQNVRWLRRLLHQRCVDSTSGQLLGLVRGRAADLVALFAGVEVDAGAVDSPDTVWCTTWCSEWFRRMMPFLPIVKGSLAHLGRGPLNHDPIPVLHVREIPDELLFSGSDSSRSSDYTGPPKGPPKPQPIHSHDPGQPLVQPAVGDPRPEPASHPSTTCRPDQRMGEVPEQRGPEPLVPDRAREPQSPQPPSPSDSQLDAIASQWEAEALVMQRAHEAAMVEQQAHEDSLEEQSYQHLISQHEAAECQDWDDWAMFDELNNPQPPRKRVLKVMMQGSEDQHAEIAVPLHHARPVELRLTLSIGAQEPERGEEAFQHALQGQARGSTWDVVAALEPDRLQTLYLQWRAGSLSSQQVVADFGPSVLEALHAEHLIYMDGAAFYEAGARHRNEPPDTVVDEPDEIENEPSQG